MARVRIGTKRSRVVVEAAAVDEVSAIGGEVERDDHGGVVVTSAGHGEVRVVCPVGSEVSVASFSGSVQTRGPLGAVFVSTASGRVEIERAWRADVRTKSGRVEVEHCDGDCKVTSLSGSIRVGRAGAATLSTLSGQIVATEVGELSARSASGKVRARMTGHGVVQVQTMSGAVDIRLPEETRPHASLASRSGAVRCECPVGSDCNVAVKTMSGAITVGWT